MFLYEVKINKGYFFTEAEEPDGALTKVLNFRRELGDGLNNVDGMGMDYRVRFICNMDAVIK